MIIDRIQLTGVNSYFQVPGNPGATNLASTGAHVIVRTDPLPQGKQVEISGIRHLIEAPDNSDLQTLFAFTSDPLVTISVVKEMFPGLFADPFRHRVHNIAGFLDFNDGTLENGVVMEVEGVPTIVSLGKDTCTWTSKKYILPEPIIIDSLAWEFATGKLSPPESFDYEFAITCWDDAVPANLITTINLSGNAGDPRFKELGSSIVTKVKTFQVVFSATVNQDSFLMERHLPNLGQQIGRPLLRAINILEQLDNSPYDIHSLNEFNTLCSDVELFDTPGPRIYRLIGTLNLNAVLVNSPNQSIVNNDIYDAASRYEYIGIL